MTYALSTADPDRYMCVDACSMTEFAKSEFDVVLDKVDTLIESTIQNYFYN